MKQYLKLLMVQITTDKTVHFGGGKPAYRALCSANSSPSPRLPGTANGKGIGDGERIDVDVLLHVVHGGVQGGLNARRHARPFVVARRSSKRSCQQLFRKKLSKLNSYKVGTVYTNTTGTYQPHLSR